MPPGLGVCLCLGRKTASTISFDVGVADKERTENGDLRPETWDCYFKCDPDRERERERENVSLDSAVACC